MIINYKTNPMDEFSETTMADGGSVAALKTLLQLLYSIDVSDMLANIDGESKSDDHLLSGGDSVVFMQEGKNAK